jgi:hypothetical protein
MIYFCRDEHRRRLVRDLPSTGGVEPPNGLDYLEVVDLEFKNTSREGDRQRVLRVYFVRPPAGALLTRLTAGPPDFTVVITGGERVTGIQATAAAFTAATGCLEITVDQRGDYSPYTLSLTEPDSADPLAELDPQLAAIDFSFKVECPSDFDCAPDRPCPVEPQPAPEPDYLAKDYASFGQLLFDRMAALLPEWRERNPADLGVTLVELLAYAGDYLSYRQDAIGTEAYLGTAQQRVSVRRHTSLLDYAMHDGCNARVWVQVQLSDAAPGGGVVLPRLTVWSDDQRQWLPGPEPVPAAGGEKRTRRTQFATRMAATTVIADDQWPALAAAQQPEVFEPLHDVTLFRAHNTIPFYAWGDDECCLPKGATKAALCDDPARRLRLLAGDVLIFAEQLGPRTGNPSDADPTRRHAVRLTRVTPAATAVVSDGREVDRTPGPLQTDAVTGQAYVEIEWDAGDALPFPFTLSSVTDAGEFKDRVSVALGNIVLADHGGTIAAPEPFAPVPAPNLVLAPVPATGCDCGGAADPPAPTPARFNPPLQQGPLTQVATLTRTEEMQGRRTWLRFDPAAPASAAFEWDLEHVLPAIRLGDDSGELWLPQRDLLSSDAFALEFVAEVDNDGRARLRFGDDEYGQRPAEGAVLRALYRVGNGARGNVGAESVCHLRAAALDDAATLVAQVGNPLPAQGGTEPETLEHARQSAPTAFTVPRRAVTPDDYAARAGQQPDVQRALATLRWTGSWHTVFVTADRFGGRTVDPPFQQDLQAFIEPYRMAGQDLEIVRPHYVPLELDLVVCVQPDYYASDVAAVLLDVFRSGYRADGTRGFFHPDEFTFGQPVLMSRIYAAAQAVPGVAHLEITTLRRLGATRPLVPADGALAIDPAEIARLDNDPNFPDRGVVRLTMKGGR